MVGEQRSDSSLFISPFRIYNYSGNRSTIYIDSISFSVLCFGKSTVYHESSLQEM